MLANTPRDAAAYCDEVFGPVASVVSFSTDDEAVALASETDYGLSLGIVTADVFAGLEMARRIPTGIVHINDQTVNDEANAPFGGVGVVGDRLASRRWAGEHRRVHRDPLDHDAPRAGAVPAVARRCRAVSPDDSVGASAAEGRVEEASAWLTTLGA